MPNGKLNSQQELKDLVRESDQILIVMGIGPTKDTVAASLGLTQVLTKEGKNVTVVSPEEIPTETKDIEGWEKIAKTFEKNFVITLKSAVGNVEKVSYYTEGDDLNLVVHPHSGAPDFSRDQIDYKTGGTSFDLIFVLGGRKLSDLGKLYTDEENLYTNASIINIDRDPQNSRFGKINLIEPSASSISEIVVSALKMAGISVDEKAATDFLVGIGWATDNFQSPQTSASAFEAVAFCLRAGGRRGPPVKTVPPSVVKPVDEEKRTMAFPTLVEPESDWLKPKIYKGGKLV